MRKEHLKLNDEEINYLTELTTSGDIKARKLKRVITLLWLSDGKSMSEVSELLDYAYPSVIKLKKNFLASGIQCLDDLPRSGRPTIFDGEQRAKLTALACSDAPEGHARWSLRLLAERAIELDLVETISHTQIGTVLKKMS